MLVEFMRWRFPYRMVTSITDGNAEPFVSDFEDNKVKALIFEERPTMRLRYLITAFHYRERVAFGWVDCYHSYFLIPGSPSVES